MTGIAAGRAERGPLRAAAWMAGTIVSFSAMAIAGREVQAELDTFELMFYRSVVALVVVGAIVLATGRRGELATRQPARHALRNLWHFTGQNLWFFAIATIPLGQAVALEFTSPIWVTLLAPLLIGEAMTRVRLLAALLGFGGVLIVAQPGVTPLGWGHAAGLGAAFFFALTTLNTRVLTRADSVLCVLFWMSAAQTIAGLALALPGGIPWPSDAALPWMGVVALTGLTAHYCLATALTAAPAAVVAPMDFARLPLMALAGAMLYAEPVSPWVLLGAALILAGNLASLRAEARGAAPGASPPPKGHARAPSNQTERGSAP